MELILLEKILDFLEFMLRKEIAHDTKAEFIILGFLLRTQERAGISSVFMMAAP